MATASKLPRKFVAAIQMLYELQKPEVQVLRSPIALRLKAAWQRVERTGVLADPLLRDGMGPTDTPSAKAHMVAGLAAAAAVPGLRQCALSSCGAREAHPAHLKSCGACRIPAYCCKEHQSEVWPAHKAACKAARKAAEVSGSGAA